MDFIKGQNTLYFSWDWFQNMISGPLSYRDFRETGLSCLIAISRYARAGPSFLQESSVSNISYRFWLGITGVAEHVS